MPDTIDKVLAERAWEMVVEADRSGSLDAVRDHLHEAFDKNRDRFAARLQLRSKVLHEHPMIRNYFAHLQTDTPEHPVRNTLPWHAIGEQLTAEMLALQNLDQLDDSRDIMQMSSTVDGIRRSQPYLLSSYCHALIKQSPLPACVVDRDAMPFPEMFFSLETAYTGFFDGKQYDVNWFMLGRSIAGIEVLHDVVDMQTAEMTLSGTAIPHQAKYPDDFDEASSPAVGFILKLLAFINSPYVTCEKQRFPRAFRRDMERLGVPKDEREQEVAVVALRRKICEQSEAQREGSVEWKHHWWVSGHFRAQWCPANATHKVMWIGPHIKGPHDKPLLEKVYAVIR